MLAGQHNAGSTAPRSADTKTYPTTLIIMKSSQDVE